MSDAKRSGCKILRPGTLEREKTLVVLGSPRGGTSMLAGLLRELGVHMGDRIDRHNHEDQAFVSEDLEQIRATIAQRNAEHPVWGWKVPDSIRYLPEIEVLLRNPHYLAVFRNPVGVAASMRRYSADMPLQTGLKRAMEYFHLIEAFIARTHDPVLLVDYEAAVAAPAALAESLGAFLRLELDGEAIKQAAAFVGASGGYRPVRNPGERARIGLQRLDAQPSGNWSPCSFSLSGINIGQRDSWFQSWNRDPQLLLDLSAGADHMPKRLLLGFELDWETQLGASQLFLDLGWGFGKHLCRELDVEKGQNLFLIEPSKPVLRLRLDPTDDNANFRVRNLQLMREG
jgi:hypothetical protein